MSFAFPLGLLGLISLPLIVVLHLLRERRRRYVVPHLELWDFLEPEVRGSFFSQIPITWLLFLDLLIASLLSLALAQPRMEYVLPVRNARHVVIIIDTSASMLAEDVIPNRFTQARAEAISLLSSLGPRDVASLIAFGDSTQYIGDTRRNAFQNLIDDLNNLQVDEIGQGIKSALVLASADLDEELPVEMHVLTDAAFPSPLADDETLEHPNYSLIWHVFGGDADNQAVLSLTAKPIDENGYQVFTRVANFGNTQSKRLITLLVDGEPIDSTPLIIPPDGVVPQVWSIPQQGSSVSVLLVGNDALSQDDVATMGIYSGHSVQVALVTDSPDPIDRALETLSNVDLRILSPNEYLLGMSFDLVIFRGVLPEKWPEGDIFVVDPPEGHHLLSVVGLEGINTPPLPVDDPLLRGVDFGGVRWGQTWVLDNISEGLTPVFQAGELPLLLRGELGSSQVTAFLPDLSSGNLSRHPAFPILIANVVQAVQSSSLPEQLLPGMEIPIPSADQYPRVSLSLPEQETVEWGSRRPAVWEETWEPGVYRLDLIDREGETSQHVIGVNAGHPNESDLRPGDWVRETQGNPVVMTSTISQQLNLTPWLLGAAILFLLWEAWLAWR